MIKVIFWNEEEGIRYEKDMNGDAPWTDIIEHAVFPGLHALTYNPGNISAFMSAIYEEHARQLNTIKPVQR